jgi:hypothetical protein
MIKGRNESRDVVTRDVLNRRGLSDQGRNNIAPYCRGLTTYIRERATSRKILLIMFFLYEIIRKGFIGEAAFLDQYSKHIILKG